MKTFEIGKTYTTRSICDSECIYSATVVARYIKVRVNATPGSVTVQGPVTGTATGVVQVDDLT